MTYKNVRSSRDDTLSLHIPSDFGKQVLADPKKGSVNMFSFVIDSIIPNMPAAIAQLQKGDSLVAINDSSYSLLRFQSLFNEHKMRLLRSPIIDKMNCYTVKYSLMKKENRRLSGSLPPFSKTKKNNMVSSPPFPKVSP